MIKVQPFKNFLGFGDGLKRGEYYYSQGMHRSRRGIKPGWGTTNMVDSDGVSGLGSIKWFAQRTEDDGVIYIFGIANDGKIYKVRQLFTNWALAATPTPAGGSGGNGLGVDREGNLVYAQDRWLGKATKANPNVYTDEWKDLGADEGNMWREIFNYEDWTFILNKNKVAGYTGDGTDFNANVFNVPDDFILKCGKPGRTGILLGANRGNEGYLILWDSYSDRSIAPWIPTDGNIFAIAPYKGQWVVASGNEIVITNGYTTRHLAYPINTTIQDISFPVNSPAGMIVKDHYLLLGAGQDLNRRKAGVWILDLETELWEFCPVSNGCTYQITIGAIFMDDKYSNYLSYASLAPIKNYIDRIFNTDPLKSFVISKPLGIGDTKKVGEGLILNLGFDLMSYEVYSSFSLKIIPKIYNFTRPLWGYAQSKQAGTVKNKIVVDGSVDASNEAEVGDEITILEGVNAGEIKHITAIAGKDTDTETWTLDGDLTANIEESIMMNVCPFKKIDTLEITTPEIKNYFFNISKKPEGKKFLIKVCIESDGKMIPEILSGSFIYNDLGFF